MLGKSHHDCSLQSGLVDLTIHHFLQILHSSLNTTYSSFSHVVETFLQSARVCMSTVWYLWKIRECLPKLWTSIDTNTHTQTPYKHFHRVTISSFYIPDALPLLLCPFISYVSLLTPTKKKKNPWRKSTIAASHTQTKWETSIWTQRGKRANG